MKKVIALLLAMMMLTLAACGGGSTDGEKKDADTTAGNNTEGTADGGEEAEEQWAKFNEDETMRAPMIEMADPVVTVVGIDQPQFNLEYEAPTVAQFFLDYYGGNIDQIVTAPEEFYSKTASMIMSGDAPDLVGTLPQGYPSVVVQDLVQPTDDIFDINDPVFAHLKEPWDQYQLGGKHYVIPWLAMVTDYVYYNKQMFEDAGLDTPRMYYERGEWDWNTYKELAGELTQDIDGDGEIDIYGASMVGWHEVFFVDSVGKDLVKPSEDGGLESNLRDPDLARGFNFLVDMIVKDKVVNPNLGNFNEMFEGEKTAMVSAPFFWQNQWPAIKSAGKQEFVPMPKDPEADKYYQSGVLLGYFVPKGTENYDAIEAFMYSAVISMAEEQVPGTEAYENQKAIEMENFPELGEEGFLKQHNWGKEYAQHPLLVHVGDMITSQTIFNRMYNEQLPYSTVVEEEEPILNAKIEEVMSVTE